MSEHEPEVSDEEQARIEEAFQAQQRDLERARELEESLRKRLG